MKYNHLSAGERDRRIAWVLSLAAVGALIYIVFSPLELTMYTRIAAYDLVFVLTAIAFNLLIAGIFVANKYGWDKPTRVLGNSWFLLTIPFTAIFVRYLAEGKGPGTMVPFGLVFLYILVEFLLDRVFKIDFRQKWITHAPYIVMEYVALYCLIHIAFDIDRTWGYLVSISFWILLASLIYAYWDQITNRKKGNNT
jgi:hypothetical protein